jgi:hypothetical protein
MQRRRDARARLRRKTVGPAIHGSVHARRPTLLALAALAAGLVVAAAAAASTRAPRLIDGHGLWTLKRLGYGERAFGPRREFEPGKRYRFGRVLYRLPKGARQGPEDWYIVRLRFRIRFMPGSRGRIWLSADTRARTSAQIEFELSPDTVGWSTVGWVDGSQSGRTTGRELELRFANYLRTAGVRGGVNALVFQVEGYPDRDVPGSSVGVESLRIYADSGIDFTPDDPAKLALSVGLPRGGARLGEPFEVPFAVENVGYPPARGVGAAAETTAPAVVEGLGENRYTRDQLKRRASLRGRFRFRPLQPGRARLFVTAGSSTSNRPGMMIDVVCGRTCSFRRVGR